MSVGISSLYLGFNDALKIIADLTEQANKLKALSFVHDWKKVETL
jgi:hypothetical protein